MKIEGLEQELREWRAKAKEQRALESRVAQQSSTIKALGNDIKNFKMQKIELHRLIKQDKENFQQYKHKRTQELLQAKRENLKKDVQIRKLTSDNNRKHWSVLRKNDELKRIRKLNETLKRLTRPLRATSRNTQINVDTDKPVDQQHLDGLIEQTLKSMLLKIDR